MEFWEIAGKTLEFDEEDHVYIYEGVIIPSITQILKVRFGGKYQSVDRDTLQRAADRGTAIHKAIERYCKEYEEDESQELRNFKFLMRLHGFRVFESETPVILHRDGEPIAAGRLDLVLDARDTVGIADIKTTSSLDKEYLAFQLNLYRIAYMQSYGVNVGALYGIHLKEDKRKVVEIPINEALAWQIVDEYERGNFN